MSLWNLQPATTSMYSGPSTYRRLDLQTSMAAKFRFDLQPENQPTDQKKNPKWNKNGTKTSGYGIFNAL